MIYQNGTPCRDQPEILGISFGDLFNIYVHINDKLVGLLLRARKQKLIDFEGECLFQVGSLSSAFFLFFYNVVCMFSFLCFTCRRVFMVLESVP